jgi:hypothetical protein
MNCFLFYRGTVDIDKKFHLVVLIVTKRKKPKYMPLRLLQLQRTFIGLRFYISSPDTLSGSSLEKEREKEQNKKGKDY